MSNSPADPAQLDPADGLRLVLGTAPPGKASEIAKALVEEGLVACANLIPGLRSLYRWQGDLCDEPETLLLLKTQVGQIQALARRWVEIHPSEVPEFLTLAPEQGLSTYLAWATAAGPKIDQTTAGA